MTTAAIVAAVVFALLGAVCVILAVVGLPGLWALVGLAFVVELADPLWLDARPAVTFGWGILVASVVLAILAELLDLGASLLGAKGGGASKRGMAGAFLGGIAGAVAGSFIFPLVGTIVGGLLGTFAGAFVAETTGPEARTREEALGPALAATIAKVLGNLAKIGITFTLWVGLGVAAFTG